MDKTIVDILTTLESNGFEAYVVGGYVRDYLLGKFSSDIDICTNALPKDLISLFNTNNVNGSNYGSIKIVTSKFNFDITTYRKEISYQDRKPTEIEYVSNLIEDLNRRDFTINTFCMNKEGEIIDLLNARKDLNNKIVRCIGDINKKLEEDPLRIIRALRFASTLGFSIENNLFVEIKNKKELVKTLSKNRIKNELDRILFNKNALKGLKMLKETGVLELIDISYNNITYVDDLMGMYSQLEISDDYPFTKSEKAHIKNIKEIVESKVIDNEVLFNYGLYTSLVAGSILNISHKEINEMYENLPIKSMQDIDITTDTICEILNIKPSVIIKNVTEDIKKEILSNGLTNENSVIIDYIITNQRKWLSAKDNR